MAVKSRKSSVWQSVHFLARFLGLTGVLAACIGAFVWQVLEDKTNGRIVAAAGLAAIAFAILFELRFVWQAVASRRGAVGLNVLLQIVAMIALVVGVNVYSFEHYRRFDLTQGKVFTLPEHIVKQLQQLRGDTDIIVLQQYVSFGQRAEYKQDKYDFAAQRKIVEKVKDLVDEFRDFSPRFHVTVLDVQEDNYQAKLDQLLKDVSTATANKNSAETDKSQLSPFAQSLSTAIDEAPENSIFFVSREQKKIQRLSFSNIYQLDKQGSINDNNLVLKYQGVEPFARKIFNIEERSPRIELAVAHPWLGMQNNELPMYTMAGAKKILDTYGFQCSDLMLRVLDESGMPTEEATALTYDESRFGQIEDDLADNEEVTAELQKELDQLQKLLNEWADSSLATLNKKYVYIVLSDDRQGVQLRSNLNAIRKSGLLRQAIDVDEDDRKNKTTLYKHNVDIRKHLLDSQREERESLLKEKSTLKADSIAEKRRLTDLEAKMKAMLANVDLLIVPRFTIENAPLKRVITNRLHRLDEAQFKAVKAFLRQGKPVLFLLGPTNLPNEVPEVDLAADNVEAMLGDLGFIMPKQTILFNVESKVFNQRKFGGEFDRAKRDVEVPGLKFDDTTIVYPLGKEKPQLHPHPIRGSLALMNRTLIGKTKEKLSPVSSQEVRVRHPRPVYFARAKSLEITETAAKIVGHLALPQMTASLAAATNSVNKPKPRPDENAVFLITSNDCWNEGNPFILNNKVPRYTPPSEGDPKKGTVEEERVGPFPIGAAAEVSIPWSENDKDGEKPASARVAVIGTGSGFTGTSLPPMKEKILLDTVNWLLGRDDLLAKDTQTWQFPRVEMSALQFNLWQWGTRLGMPLLFVYLGTVVWMVRRMR